MFALSLSHYYPPPNFSNPLFLCLLPFFIVSSQWDDHHCYSTLHTFLRSSKSQGNLTTLEDSLRLVPDAEWCSGVVSQWHHNALLPTSLDLGLTPTTALSVTVLPTTQNPPSCHLLSQGLILGAGPIVTSPRPSYLSAYQV